MSRLVEDSPLREAFRRGERAALAEVYQEYVRPLFAMLQRGFAFESKGRRIDFCGFTDPPELENLVQEVFVRAFQERARLAYDGLRPYRNYLFAIAKNLVADEYRRRTRQFVSLDSLNQPESVEVPSQGENPDEPGRELEARQLQKHIDAFLEELTAVESAVFHARFRDAHSIEAAAKILQVSEHRIKTTEQKLRRRFFHTMRRHGYFEGYEYRDLSLHKMSVMLLALGWGLA